MILEFGKYNIQVKSDSNQAKIYDIIRKKWLIMTPEEEVRQVWIHFLISDLAISPSKIAVEKGLKINDRIKRFDLCIYDENLFPKILIECKSPQQMLSTPNLEQLSVYNIALNASIFILTNGVNHLGYKIEGDKLIQIKYISDIMQ